MNIDERIGALTQSVELLAFIHRDSEKRFEAFMAESQKRTDVLEKHAITFMDTVNRIGRILEHHDL